MPSSTSSQESRVSAGRRTLLERRRRFGPRHNYKTNMMTYVGVVEMCEGALATLAHRERLAEEARGEADRSVRAPVHGAGAAEDDDDDDDCQVLYVTPGPHKRRKYVLDPLTDCKDVSKGAPVAVQGRKRDVDELKADPLQTLACNCDPFDWSSYNPGEWWIDNGF